MYYIANNYFQTIQKLNQKQKGLQSNTGSMTHMITSEFAHRESTYKSQEDCTGGCWFFLYKLYVFQFVFLFCILWNIQVLWRYLTYDYLT